MKRLYRFLSVLLALAIPTLGIAAGAEASGVALPQLDDCFTVRDLSGDWDATAVEILLTGDTAETRSHEVGVDGGTVTIEGDGVYVLSGTLADGSIVINVDDDERVQLVLNGVDITCSDGPAIRVEQADKVFITLAEGTENRLTSESFAEEGVEAVIYSGEDLTFNGTGTLVIASPAGDGIDGKDDVKFASGTYVISAAGRGIDANDSVRIADGDFTITTDGDAIRCKHDSNDELGYIYIWNGTFAITAGGGSDNAAIKTTNMGFGGMMGGGPQGENGEMPTPPDFSGGAALDGSSAPDNADGEMPTPPDFSGGAAPDGSSAPDNADGEMPSPPDFSGGSAPDGSSAPDNADGEMPTPPDFSGGSAPDGSSAPDNADGEMPSPPDFGGGSAPDGSSAPNNADGEMPTPSDFGGGSAPDGSSALSSEGQPPASNGSPDASMESEEAVSAKGLKASGDIVILGGSFTFDTADDALHADGDLILFDGALSIASGDDGIHAEGTLSILGSDVSIDKSYEGLEAKVIAISGGNVSVTASDDGLNAADGSLNGESFDAQEGVLIEISGGSLYVNADGDGIDSNGDIEISGGTVTVSGPVNGANGALDYNGTAIITGGTVIAAGASGMAENFSEGSTQPAFLVSLSGDAGEITVSDTNGEILLAAAVEKSFGTVVVSCPELIVGETYTVSCGDASAEITLTDAITGTDSGGMGTMGGFPGSAGMPGRSDGE